MQCGCWRGMHGAWRDMNEEEILASLKRLFRQDYKKLRPLQQQILKQCRVEDFSLAEMEIASRGSDVDAKYLNEYFDSLKKQNQVNSSSKALQTPST